MLRIVLLKQKMLEYPCRTNVSPSHGTGGQQNNNCLLKLYCKIQKCYIFNKFFNVTDSWYPL